MDRTETADTRAQIAVILKEALSVEDAERQLGDLVGRKIKLDVIAPTKENAVACAFTSTIFGGKVIERTGHVIVGVDVLGPTYTGPSPTPQPSLRARRKSRKKFVPRRRRVAWRKR